MKVVFTRFARQDLGRVRRFIADHNPSAAAAAARRIKAVVQIIADHPLGGRAVHFPAGDAREDIREIPIPFGSGGYLLRYQVLPEEIRILRIWHGKEARHESFP